MTCLIYCSVCLISVAEVDGNTFWRHPFSGLCGPRQLEEFIVMDIDIIRDQKLGAGAGLKSNKVQSYRSTVHTGLCYKISHKSKQR